MLSDLAHDVVHAVSADGSNVFEILWMITWMSVGVDAAHGDLDVDAEDVQGRCVGADGAHFLMREVA